MMSRVWKSSEQTVTEQSASLPALTSEQALIALAATSWAPRGDLLPADAEIDELFKRGVLANAHDFTGEVETILTGTGCQQVRAAVEAALGTEAKHV